MHVQNTNFRGACNTSPTRLKKKLKTTDGWTRREKNTCTERFKGNVGLRTCTLQSHGQSYTNRNRNHKNTSTEIISCDNKILCKEEEYKYTSLVLQRGVCVRERDVLPQKKVLKCELAGMRSKNKPPKQNTMRNEEGMKEEREKSTEEHEEEEKDTFEIFFL